MTQLTFNNDPALKALHVEQARRHVEQDMLIFGTFGQVIDNKFRGCSVGCFSHEINPEAKDFHATVAAARHLPEWLVRLQDSMYEGLPAKDRPGFHIELAERIPHGVDIAQLPHMIAIARIDRMLVTQRNALSAARSDELVKTITLALSALEVARRFHEGDAGVDADLVQSAAESATERSAQSAAWSAERSTCSVAWSAAEQSAWSAERSAWSAAQSAAWSAAQSAESAAMAAAERSAWSATESATERSAQSAAWSAAQSAMAAEQSAWSAAQSAAWSAAEAAESAAWSAQSAAWSAEQSAEQSAWSAAQSATERSAMAAAWIEERDSLFACLAELEQQA